MFQSALVISELASAEIPQDAAVTVDSQTIALTYFEKTA